MGIPWGRGIIGTIDEVGARRFTNSTKKAGSDRKSKTFLAGRFPGARQYTLERFRMQTLSTVIESTQRLSKAVF
jgi:hypothetical protein